jgi:hypothetical protein
MTSYLLLSHSIRRADEMIGVSIAAVAMALTLGPGLFGLVNCHFDSTMPVLQTWRVIDLEKGYHDGMHLRDKVIRELQKSSWLERHTVLLLAVLEPMDGSPGRKRIAIDTDWIDVLIPGQSGIELTRRTGRFKLEWIEGCRPSPNHPVQMHVIRS